MQMDKSEGNFRQRKLWLVLKRRVVKVENNNAISIEQGTYRDPVTIKGH